MTTIPDDPAYRRLQDVRRRQALALGEATP